MTEQEEFLDKLKYPNRDPIEKNIKLWLDNLMPDGILDIHVNRDKGSNFHVITIEADDLTRYLTIDSVFFYYFPHDYAHGAGTPTNTAPGPAKGSPPAFTKIYLVREY